jgi:hypothetical protein
MENKNEKAKRELELLRQCCEGFDEHGIVWETVAPILQHLQKRISDNDRFSSRMTVDNDRCSQSHAQSGSLLPLKIARLGTVTTVQEIVFLYLHCTLLKLGFSCTVEIPSSVPGFAATIRGEGSSPVFKVHKV